MKLDTRTMVFILVSMGLSLGGSVVCALTRGGWVSATILNVVVVGVMIAWTARERNPLLARMLVLSAVAGLVEVAVADPPFIDAGILTYLGDGPVIVESPAYMPLGWIYVVTQIGAIALWMDERFGVWISSVATMVLGAVMIPIYETLAKFAQWWFYTDPHMLFGTTPWFVVASEGLIGLGIAVLVRPLDRRPAWWAPVLGVLMGLWMWVAGEAAHRLIG